MDPLNFDDLITHANSPPLAAPPQPVRNDPTAPAAAPQPVVDETPKPVPALIAAEPQAASTSAPDAATPSAAATSQGDGQPIDFDPIIAAKDMKKAFADEGIPVLPLVKAGILAGDAKDEEQAPPADGLKGSTPYTPKIPDDPNGA